MKVLQRIINFIATSDICILEEEVKKEEFYEQNIGSSLQNEYRIDTISTRVPNSYYHVVKTNLIYID